MTREIFENLPSTAQLALASMAVAVGLGVALGPPGRGVPQLVARRGSMVVALVGVSMPSFWLGLLLILVFSLFLGWLPATGGATLRTSSCRR